MHYIITLIICLCLMVNNEIVNSTTCNNMVPGISRMGQGIDITLLDINHDYTVDNKDGYKNLIIDFTCNENKTWVSPFEGKIYQIPDQINEVVAVSSGLVFSKTKMQFNLEEVRKSMSSEVGADGILGMFSASLSYKESQYSLINISQFLAQISAFVSTTEIDYIPAPFLNISLSKYVRYYYNQLPEKYDNDPAAYMTFFGNYGTHYFERGNFGGTLSSWFQIQKYLRKIMNDYEISANVKASFLNLLKAHGAYDGNVSKVSENFIENSLHKERYFGGSANLFETEGYKKWWPTVAGNPWLYSGQLKPITDLFPNEPKRDELIKASGIYIIRSYLTELQRTLYSFLGKGYYGEDIALVFNIIVEEQINMVEPDINLIKLLGSNITNYIITPEWFTEQSQLCVIWGGDGFPCGKISNCFVMGLKTSDTELFKIVNRYLCFDSCSFLISGNHPDWFNITIESTHERLDYYSYQLYYKFNIPVSSPGWLQNVKFCAYYDSNQICIPPNTTTPHILAYANPLFPASFKISFVLIPMM